MNITQKFLSAGTIALSVLVPALAGAVSQVGFQPYCGSYNEGSCIGFRDDRGREYQIRLPKTDDPGFKEAGLEAFTDYAQESGLEFDDRGAAEFLRTMEFFAGYADVTMDSLAEEIGIDREVYQGLLDQQERLNEEYRRWDAVGMYDFIINAQNINDLMHRWTADRILSLNEEHIRQANQELEQAVLQYPGDPLFNRTPLTGRDLQNIRQNVAFTNVYFVLDVFESIDSGLEHSRLLHEDTVEQLTRIVELLYEDIQKAPEQGPGEMGRGYKYNREIPVFMDEELASMDIDREDFYRRLVELVNYYDRTRAFDSAPPPVPPALDAAPANPAPDPKFP